MAKGRSKNSASDDDSNLLDLVWSAFRATTKRLGLKLKRRKGAAVTVCYPSGEQAINLGNLAKQLQQYDQDRWDGLLEQFVQHMAPAHLKETVELVRQPFAQIKHMLMPCLGSPRPEIWSRELAQDLHLLLAIDTPNHILYVSDEVIGDSGRPAEAWMQQAEENLLERTPPDWYTVVLEEPYELRVTTAEDCYDSARSLILDRLLPHESQRGWIVAPVGRDTMLFVPDQYDDRDEIIGELAAMVASRLHEIAYRISHRIYTLKRSEWSTKPMILGPGNMPLFIEMDPPWLSDEADEAASESDPG